MDGDEGRAAKARRQRVLEVDERRPQAAQRAWDAAGHPDDLAPGLQAQWLDTRGHELRRARERDKTKSRVEPTELAEEVLDVRLVPGPPPPEHVGVDDDERSRVNPHRPPSPLTPQELACVASRES